MTTDQRYQRREEVHARASAESDALCGTPPNGKRWTKKKREVTCAQCLDEVCRLEAKAKTAK